MRFGGESAVTALHVAPLCAAYFGGRASNRLLHKQHHTLSEGKVGLMLPLEQQPELSLAHQSLMQMPCPWMVVS